MTAAQPNTLDRRQFMRGLAAAGLLAGTASVGGSARAAASTRLGTASVPTTGGRLRIGLLGAGSAESFDPSMSISSLINSAASTAVFDALVNITPDGEIDAALAVEWAANDDATEWTFTLREGVTWHDGSPLTADDVVYTMGWLAGSGLAGTVANVDTATVRAVDQLTVVVPMLTTDLLFPYDIAGSWVIKDGTTDFTHPIGTGPFVFAEHQVGQRSLCTRNPDYWDAPRPYVDELELISIDDDAARLNALLGGQVDVIGQVPYVQAAQQLPDDFQLIRIPGIGAQAFYMAVDQPPFDDVRVRQALRLLVDREQLVAVALYGFGAVANDLFGAALPYYADALPQRTRDVDAAKALLEEAGYGDGLTVELQTSAVSPGMVEAATLFQQQAAEGGVTVEISQVDPSAYFDPTRNYLTMPFAQTHWSGFYTLSGFYQTSLLAGAQGNETHWSSPETEQLIADAIGAADEESAAEAWALVQQEQYDSGGYIWWASLDNLDAASNQVAGIEPTPYFMLGLPFSLARAYFVQ